MMDGTSEPHVGRGCLEPSPEITYNEFNDMKEKFHWLQTAYQNHPIKLHGSYPSYERPCHKTVDVVIKCERLP